MGNQLLTDISLSIIFFGFANAQKTTYTESNEDEGSGGIGMAEIVAIVVLSLLTGAFILVCIIMLKNGQKRARIEAAKKSKSKKMKKTQKTAFDDSNSISQADESSQQRALDDKEVDGNFAQTRQIKHKQSKKGSNQTRASQNEVDEESLEQNASNLERQVQRSESDSEEDQSEYADQVDSSVDNGRADNIKLKRQDTKDSTVSNVSKSSVGSIQMSQIGRPAPLSPSPDIFYKKDYNMDTDPRVLSQRKQNSEGASQSNRSSSSHPIAGDRIVVNSKELDSTLRPFKELAGGSGGGQGSQPRQRHLLGNFGITGARKNSDTLSIRSVAKSEQLATMQNLMGDAPYDKGDRKQNVTQNSFNSYNGMLPQIQKPEPQVNNIMMSAVSEQLSNANESDNDINDNSKQNGSGIDVSEEDDADQEEESEEEEYDSEEPDSEQADDVQKQKEASKKTKSDRQ